MDPIRRAEEVLHAAEEEIDRSRNLRHLLALKRALRAKLQEGTDDPGPPSSG